MSKALNRRLKRVEANPPVDDAALLWALHPDPLFRQHIADDYAHMVIDTADGRLHGNASVEAARVYIERYKRSAALVCPEIYG